MIQRVDDMEKPIGEVLQLAGTDGVLLQARGQSPFALIPLNEELLDFLIERNPRFIEDCRQIRQRMAHGSSHSQDDVNLMFR